LAPDPLSAQPEPERPARRRGCCFGRIVRPIVAGVALVLCIFALAYMRPYEVPSGSMEPTLMEEDRIATLLFQGKVPGPGRGDVVILKHPDETGHWELLVKRVVAVPGDRLKIEGGSLYRNGDRVDEPYVDAPMVDTWPTPTWVRDARLSQSYPMEFDRWGFVVPDGCVFVLGDNRNLSEDSRDWGPVPNSDLIGRVIGIYWPMQRIGRVR